VSRRAWVSEVGTTASEYLGILVVVAVVIAALATSSIGATIYDAIDTQVCKIAGGDGC
jgi:Flp pilus assembly pilin Flp